jgi:hypothetical protein
LTRLFKVVIDCRIKHPLILFRQLRTQSVAPIRGAGLRMITNGEIRTTYHNYLAKDIKRLALALRM